MAQNTDVASVDVDVKPVDGGVFVLVRKFGVGSDVSGRFKVSAYASVEPVADLPMFLPFNGNEFNVEALGEVLSALLKTVRVTVRNHAIALEQDFFEGDK